jgi:hypothetical protein
MTYDKLVLLKGWQKGGGGDGGTEQAGSGKEITGMCMHRISRVG